MEPKIKKVVLENVSRGKIDVYVSFSNYSEKGKNIRINQEIARVYIKELRKLAEEERLLDDLSIIELSRLPEVMKIENVQDEEIIWSELLICLQEAITGFKDMRKLEGSKLYYDISERLHSIQDKVEQIFKYSTGLVKEYIVKLEERIKELLQTDVVDKNRLAQEVVIYSDKCSINEEIIRINSHLSQLENLLKQDASVGKKLDFIIQELNREVNTIASKANNLDVINLVIDIKTELENIREQIQNVE